MRVPGKFVYGFISERLDSKESNLCFPHSCGHILDFLSLSILILLTRIDVF